MKDYKFPNIFAEKGIWYQNPQYVCQIKNVYSLQMTGWEVELETNFQFRKQIDKMEHILKTILYLEALSTF